MSWASDVRDKANARRRGLDIADDELIPASTVLAACSRLTGIETTGLPPTDPLLVGSLAILDITAFGSARIFFDRTVPVEQRNHHIAHEFAHHWIHSEIHACTSEDLDDEAQWDPLPIGVARVEGYSPKQRKELEANLFGAELLLPRRLARKLFLDDGIAASRIASELGVTLGLVQAQLVEAILLSYESVPELAEPQSPDVDLDPSQKVAAKVLIGPVLVAAGPGTGKTETLVGRCKYLATEMNPSVAPSSILALTFSNKAAREMRQRLVAAGIGSVESGPWVGTFHGFGLELLRRFHERADLPLDVRLLDAVDGIALLENNLGDLDLQTLTTLYNPAYYLRGILEQISRAKDELCSPERYATLCDEMRRRADEAADEWDRKIGKKLKRDIENVQKPQMNAVKAAEVSRCYVIYERIKRDLGVVDYGDLIVLAVRLLESNTDILDAMRQQYPHVLADEYQDVNRASARLLQLLAGPGGTGLWVVGDVRQSIYRFRGAAPSNVASFEHDYPAGSRKELGWNYRSYQPIVDVFAAAAKPMVSDSDPAPSWEAKRGTPDRTTIITYAIARTDVDQAAGIAGLLRDHAKQGYGYRGQAILCTTHTQAISLCSQLSELGIDALYLGELLDRPEVKDMLSIMSLAAERIPHSLFRALQMPEYRIGRDSALAVVRRFEEEHLSIPRDLLDSSLWQDYGQTVVDQLCLLGTHLSALSGALGGPGLLLRQYLFDTSTYITWMKQEATSPFAFAQQQMALSQLLGLTASFNRRVVISAANGVGGNDSPNMPASGLPARQFLAYLRQLANAGERLRGVVPEAAEHLDAVRVMTVHGAKGLEFPVVYLPNIARDLWPGKGWPSGVPEPPDLSSDMFTSTQEGQCLFFVALSRARDRLILSRSQWYTGRVREFVPSSVLQPIEAMLSSPGVQTLEWNRDGILAASSAAMERQDPGRSSLDQFTEWEIDEYIRCPRSYYYDVVLKLRGAHHGSGYRQFVHCVRLTIGWIQTSSCETALPSETAALEYLDTVWAEKGPIDHPHADRYRAAAQDMIRVAHQRAFSDLPITASTELRAIFPGYRVLVEPHVIATDAADGMLIAAYYSTAKSDGFSAEDHSKMALYRRACADTITNRAYRAEIRFLRTGTVQSGSPEGDSKSLKRYENAVANIQLQVFNAEPDRPDRCPTCAYSMICPL